MDSETAEQLSSVPRMKRNPRLSLPIRISNLFHNTNHLPVLNSKMKLICTSPPIYLIRNFVTEKELIYLDSVCENSCSKFERSFTENDDNDEVISEYRTSHYMYLSKSKDTIVRNIERKAADIVGMRSEFVEPLQIVSYRNGQKFDVHHDAGTLDEDTGEVELVLPRRLVTMFIYLNTLPEGQGHTEFPLLHLSIKPERGQALLFCNVTASGTLDKRVLHRACPVTDGFHKYGMNVWISDSSMQELALVEPSVSHKKRKCDHDIPKDDDKK